MGESPIVERRRVPVEGIEVRQTNGVAQFSGHAAVFNKLTDLGPFREKVAPGSFKKTILESDVAFLFNHNDDTVMARTKSGTLVLREDRTGLATTAELDTSDSDVQRIIPKLRRGDLSQMSFAFRAIKEDWNHNPEDGGTPIRTLEEVGLFDVSVVTFPAYEATDASIARSVEKIYERRMHQIEVEQEPAMKVEEGSEGERSDDNSEETDTDDEERTEPLEADQPSREEHSLAERRALRDARIKYLEETLL